MMLLRLALYSVMLSSSTFALAGNVSSGPTYAPGGHAIVPTAPAQTHVAPAPAPARTNIVPSTPNGSTPPAINYAPGGHAIIPTLPQAPTATFNTGPNSRPSSQPTTVQTSGAQLGTRPALINSPSTVSSPSQSMGNQGGQVSVGQIPPSTPGRLQLTPVTGPNGNGVLPHSAPTALSFNSNPNGTVLVTLSNGTQTLMTPQQAAAQYGYQTPSSTNPGYFTTPSGAVVNAATGQLVSAPPPATPSIPNTGVGTSTQINNQLSLKPGPVTTSVLPPVGSSGIANTTPQTTQSQTQKTSASSLSQMSTERFPKAYSAPVPINAPHDTGFYDSSYEEQFGKQHLGVDLGAPAGTPVNSPVGGTIKGYYPDGINSFVVIQQSGTSTQHVLGHITCDTCKPGEQVVAGQPFGATVLNNPEEGDHVHWGANYNGIPLTPTAGWGWGDAPATSTPAEAAAKGWFNPLQGY
jgi:murein DD-endopeptidase MepM/ murein hydrolase activator NlpD